jgi:hypothetical protein
MGQPEDGATQVVEIARRGVGTPVAVFAHMMRPQQIMAMAVLAALAGGSAIARADGASGNGEVEVTRTRRPSRLVLDAFLGFGPRRVSSAAGVENASGLALGALIGRRLGGHFGVVSLIEVDAMALDRYISYGAWTFGGGLRFEGPVLLSAGVGLVLGNSKQLVGYQLVAQSFTGAAAFAHVTLPVYRFGRGRIGVTADVAVKSVEAGTRIVSTSFGAVVSW